MGAWVGSGLWTLFLRSHRKSFASVWLIYQDSSGFSEGYRHNTPLTVKVPVPSAKNVITY